MEQKLFCAWFLCQNVFCRKMVRRLTTCSVVLLMLLSIGCRDDSSGHGEDNHIDIITLKKRTKDTAYAIVAEVDYADKKLYATIGTAFAIRSRLLATNAHVTEAFSIDASTFPLGYIVKDIFAIQSGTGEVFVLTRALTHSQYNGDPLGSPDVGLFTTLKELPEVLSLASSEEVDALYDNGKLESAKLILSGFPGDVQKLFEIEPEITVPQATTLEGSTTSLRNFNTSVRVVADSIDIVQHQLPTTPGTSGSALVTTTNGKVIAVNNAGTIETVIKLDANGNPFADRVAAAANNFGIHVKYLHELIDGFDSNSIQGFALPLKGTEYTGKYSGSINNSSTTFVFTIDAKDNLFGISFWPNNVELPLFGKRADNLGKFLFIDNGQPRGAYSGYINTGLVQNGVYSEENSNENFIEKGNWNATKE